jgi:tRNA-dihydrouridine synthase 2
VNEHQCVVLKAKPIEAKRKSRMDRTEYQEKAWEMWGNGAEILAPMVRASSTPLRTTALHYGASLVYSEELVDRSILSTHRVVSSNNGVTMIDYVKNKEGFSAKVLRRMEANGETLPILIRLAPQMERGKIILQLGTGDPDLALQAARHVYEDVDGIDVNMGCPKKFSISGGMGSVLLKDVDRACRIIRALSQHIPRPISAKIRLLETVEETVQFVRSLIAAGANAICIHARHVGDASQSPAKWDFFIQVLQQLKSNNSNGSKVPIVLNGDLYTRNDIESMKERSGVDGIMLARPALYNTSLFASRSTNKMSMSTKREVIQVYLQQALLYQSHYKNVKYILCEMLSHRRTPSQRVPELPLHDENDDIVTVAQVCQCKSLSQLCSLWDVQPPAPTTTHDNDTTTATTTTATAAMSQSTTVLGEQRYDDAYFLDHPSCSVVHTNDDPKKPSTTSTSDDGDQEEKKMDTTPTTASTDHKDGHADGINNVKRARLS